MGLAADTLPGAFDLPSGRVLFKKAGSRGRSLSCRMLQTRFCCPSYRLGLSVRAWSRLLVGILTGSLVSCMDLFVAETPIHGPYYVSHDPAASFYTLYYRGTGAHEGLDFERVRDVSQVGYQAGYVFLQCQARYYWFEVRQDQETDLGDPAIEHLLSPPLTARQFQRVADSLGIGPVTFQF